MTRSLAITLCTLLCAAPNYADELKDAVAAVEKTLEAASKDKDAKGKAEKYGNAKAALTKSLEAIKASKKIYTDEELAQLYQYRGVVNYELREYGEALDDFTLASKLDPEKVTPWLHLAWIKSSAPTDKLRDGKEALAAADAARKALKKYAAKVPRSALEKFERATIVLELEEECGLATAAAYAEMGKFKEAINLIKDGREEAVKPHLDAYREGKPFRLPVKP